MNILLAFDYFGVFVFAITGALVAARKDMDVFGFVVLALMPAVGGGTIRDLILDVPVFWVANTHYLFVTLAAAALTFVACRFIEKQLSLLVWLDALGLAVFCAIGASKSLSIVDDLVVAVMMGVVTAVAGGILRDVIANESPLVLHKEVYATAAFVGAVTCVACLSVFPDIDSIAGIVVGTVAAFVTRALGIKLGLSLPTLARE